MEAIAILRAVWCTQGELVSTWNSFFRKSLAVLQIDNFTGIFGIVVGGTINIEQLGAFDT